MKRKILITLAVVGALLVWLVVQIYRADQRATYQGKHVRVWVAELDGNPDPYGTNNAVKAFRAMGSNAVPALRSLLNKPTPFYERLFVQQARRIPASPRRYLLGKINPGQALTLRTRAAQALGLIGPDAAAAIPDLIAALADGDVRWSAAQALPRIGEKAIVALVVETTNVNADVRHSAVYALGEAGTNAAPVAAVLFDRVLDPRENQAVRGSALHSLSRVGPTAVPMLLESLASPDPARRAAAGNAIKAMNSTTRHILTSLLGYSTNSPALRQRSIEALQILRLNHPQVIATCVRALQDPDPGVRCAAAQAMNHANVWTTNMVLSQIAVHLLGQTGELDSIIVASLTVLLDDPEQSVRTTAQQALINLQASRAN